MTYPMHALRARAGEFISLRRDIHRYDFNDHNVAIGSAYWVLLAQRFLASKERAATR